MQFFKSDLSGKTFPITQKISGNAVRQCIADEIKKDFLQWLDQQKNLPMTRKELDEYMKTRTW